MLRYDNNPRGLLRIKQKKTPTEYNSLNYCVLLLIESSCGANFRSSLKPIVVKDEFYWMRYETLKKKDFIVFY